MLKRVRDFAQVMSDGVITLDTARTALDRLEIDELGLDNNDRRMLEAIIRFYNGGPVGLETRCITAEGCRHLGYSFPKGAVQGAVTQPNLFGN